MPAFEPTAERREIVYQCSDFGLPQTDICRLKVALAAVHEPLHWDAIRLLTASIPASSSSRFR